MFTMSITRVALAKTLMIVSDDDDADVARGKYDYDDDSRASTDMLATSTIIFFKIASRGKVGDVILVLIISIAQGTKALLLICSTIPLALAISNEFVCNGF